MPNGEGFTFGDALDGIAGALSDIVQAILGFLQQLLQFLLQVLNFIWSVIVAGFNFFAALASKVRDFFRALWHLGFRGFLGKLWDVFKKIKDFLHRIFDPIICAIRVIIAHETAVFNQFIRPLLNLLQRIRTFLLLLRLLHVKWAVRLDARLAQIEGRLAQLGLGVLRELNNIRNYIALILDGFGLFNAATFGKSVIRSVGDVWAAVHDSQERPLLASEIETNRKDRKVFSKDGLSKAESDDYFGGLSANVDVELKDITG